MAISIKIGAAASAVVAIAALSACSTGAGTDVSASASGGSDTITPVNSMPAAVGEVDTVTWALTDGEPDSLDPVYAENWAVVNLCENLFMLNPDYSISPNLATGAEWTDDTTYVITLRDDVTFWDGTPMTSEDVAYSMSRNLGNFASYWYSAYALVQGVEATGDHEVTVSFYAHDEAFESAMADIAGAVVEKAYAEEAGDDFGSATGGLMCTGPYELQSWTPGQEIATTAYADYWNGAPLVAELDYVFVTDPTTLTNALLAGEVDGAFHVPYASRETLEDSDSGQLVVGESNRSVSLGPLSPEGLAANVDIRKALSMAIDRATLIDNVYHGLGYPQKTFASPFATAGLETADIYAAGYEALPEQTYDIEAAKALVDEVAASGVDTTQPIVIASIAGQSDYEKVATIVQSAAAAIGLTIEVEQLQFPDYFALFYEPESRDGYDMFIAEGYQSAPDVIGYAQMFIDDPTMAGIYNLTGYDNADALAAIQAARTATDPTVAAEAFVESQAIYHDAYLQITIAGLYETTYIADDLTGAVTSLANQSSPWALRLGATSES